MVAAGRHRQTGGILHRRCAPWPLDEAHDLLRLLQATAGEDGPLSPEADRWAQELAARIPPGS
ncbi:DUF6417 family protein [Streptomyces liliifuscus]|uniref:DUF6417 family protein n=1 Tax=Streptomyces liliifuscus TaxID=2797636 RepID=UPI00389AF8DB